MAAGLGVVHAGSGLFEGLQPDASWAFGHLSQAQTSYATHGYHRYPAKFIPQLAARLIREYSIEGKWVVDPFMGSGTTLVEAKLLRRPSVGVDINPVAYLIARAKVWAIEPARLQHAVEQIALQIDSVRQPNLFRDSELTWELPSHGRLLYWFPPESLKSLMRIQAAIDSLDDVDIKDFFLCALSHCLKPVSYWSDKSVKPTRKLTKAVPDALAVFFRHVKRMQRGNREFWQLLCEQDALNVPAEPHCADARYLPMEDGSAHLIVTSPPYVTSYEYADLHQLSVLWFNAATSLREFRERFIGRSNGVEEVNCAIGSPLARQIVDKLSERNPRKAREVALYFAEMYQCFVEMRRILSCGGRVCIVIGNTHLHGVEIQNAQVFAEQLAALGFELERVILREIPSKILPRTRDKETGKFAKTAEADYIAYPTEYIIVLRKQ
jgi:DNA modification methylase